MRSLVKSAEKIKADPTIREDLKKAFLDINQFLRAELKRYDEAQGILRRHYHRPGDILAPARAKRQVQDTEGFTRGLKRVMNENERKKIAIKRKEVRP
jgi:hypothetical protein